jgi:hypothetical protein
VSPTDQRAGRFRYKDLCLDAVDPLAVAPFWSAALGLAAEPRGSNVVLTDDVPEHTLWLNKVPEPKTVKQRVHLDLHVGSEAELIHLGATVLDDTLPWMVLQDPEGGELCAFVRPDGQLPVYRLYELVVDAADPQALATWWGERFGVAVQRDDDDGSYWLDDVPGMPWPLVFGAVPEPKTVKNRIHWDLWGTSADAFDAGARLIRPEDDDISWDVLADPEGNEFCVFTPERSTDGG